MSSQTKVVAVTGATGAIGPTLVERLQRVGYGIRVLVRREHREPLFGGSVQVEHGDICDPAAVSRLVRNAHVIFHLAAKLHRADPAVALHSEYRRVNVEGTCNVVQQAVAAGAHRLVYISTTTVYGPTEGQVIDEGALPRPNTIYSRTKLEGEQVALAAHRADDDGPLAVVLRLATVYGPRQKGNFQRLVRALARGWFVPVGDGRNRRTLVYVHDVVEAMLLAAEHPKAAGRVFNVTDGRVHRMRDILTAICQALGRPAPRLHFPLHMGWLGATSLEYAFALVGRHAPVTRATLGKFVEEAAYSGQRIQTDLGFHPTYDLEAGWQETIAELRRKGEL